MSVQTEINRINNEVTSQADLIAQIQTALEGKAGGGSSGESLSNIISVTVTNHMIFGSLYYWNEEKEIQTISGNGQTQTVNAFNGVIFGDLEMSNSITGDYIQHIVWRNMMFCCMFFSDGGTLISYSQDS